MHFLLYINGQRQRHLTQNTLSYRLYTNFTENIYSYLSFEWWQNRNKKHTYIYIHKYNRDKTEIFAVVLEMQMYPKWIFTLNVSLRIDPTNIPPEKEQQQKKKNYNENENQTFEEHGEKKKFNSAVMMGWCRSASKRTESELAISN